jgi:nitrite reductase/ring-hydroxylating ferredoxin subunit
MDARLTRISEWTRKRFPTFGKAEYSWSGQVMEPMDFMPFSGRSPGSNNVYMHTGDSGQGITNGVAGSLTIVPLIMGEDSRFADVLDPKRKSFASIPSVQEFARGVGGAVVNFAEYVTSGEISSADELKPGEGGVLREGIHKIALYRTEVGQLVRRSAVCTHMGCIVHWNSFERCWDCPCHGSQFAPDGEVLNGPAVKPLADEEA